MDPDRLTLFSLTQSTLLGKNDPEKITLVPTLIRIKVAKSDVEGSMSVSEPMSERSLFHVSTRMSGAKDICNTPFPSLLDSSWAI